MTAPGRVIWLNRLEADEHRWSCRVGSLLGTNDPATAAAKLTALVEALRAYVSKCPWCDDNGKQGGYVGYERFRFDCVHCGWARVALAAIPAQEGERG